MKLTKKEEIVYEEILKMIRESFGISRGIYLFTIFSLSSGVMIAKEAGVSKKEAVEEITELSTKIIKIHADMLWNDDNGK